MKLYLYKSQKFENSWSARIGSKDEAYYMPITFGKCDKPVKDKVTINAVDFFLSTFKKKDGTIEPKLVITDYEVVRDK